MALGLRFCSRREGYLRTLCVHVRTEAAGKFARFNLRHGRTHIVGPAYCELWVFVSHRGFGSWGRRGVLTTESAALELYVSSRTGTNAFGHLCIIQDAVVFAKVLTTTLGNLVSCVVWIFDLIRLSQ